MSGASWAWHRWIGYMFGGEWVSCCYQTTTWHGKVCFPVAEKAESLPSNFPCQRLPVACRSKSQPDCRGVADIPGEQLSRSSQKATQQNFEKRYSTRVIMLNLLAATLHGKRTPIVGTRRPVHWKPLNEGEELWGRGRVISVAFRKASQRSI